MAAKRRRNVIAIKMNRVLHINKKNEEESMRLNHSKDSKGLIFLNLYRFSLLGSNIIFPSEDICDEQP